MAERERIQKPSRSSAESEAAASQPGAGRSGERLKAELDDLLDEIDEVLETNAEEFVNSYIQKGGE
ncbi:MAG: ubiquitin-like protein Pup [bacterium]|nr:ubiquitin-like protein Pup [bacterium]MDE0669575.1 ubiquitin-like protein Pup [bacterium]MXZ29340.1 ubiquitin-like protein Pup [Acidimicrobiia bacterium]MYB25273.1 ubiquitin-like protein Pup [Acidimicrobiia bacterium]MYJ14084.1 ubiquitin-like protein Pup [Acidimicrobiia bacterium]